MGMSSWGAAGGAWSVLVHGGAGDVPKDARDRHMEGCRAAAAESARLLASGASALDAAVRAVEVLENDPVFNAGTGACLNELGLVELDASVMEGAGLRGGGVAALPPFANPILIARAVLEEGRHVLYAGEGASRFARASGFRETSSEALTSPVARERWEKLRALRHDDGAGRGTVGAVVRDGQGLFVAATSTGGRIDKRVGRVGDSPLLGAGTYADNEAGACSTTGDGEAMMRLCLAKTAVEWMRSGLPAEEAARGAVQLLGHRLGASGGLILLDRQGRLGLARNTKVMTWAAMTAAMSEVQAGA